MKISKFLILGFLLSLFLSTLTVFAKNNDPLRAFENGLDTYGRIKTETQNTIWNDVNFGKNSTKNTNNTSVQNNQGYNQQNYSQQQEYNQNYYQQLVQQPVNPQEGAAITLGSLPQGAVVVDINSNWNFKRAKNYTGEIIKTEPVAWIVASQGNYGAGKTLLISKDIVANYNFYGKNQNSMTNWQNSDLRACLRSTFYNHFSPQFKNAIAVVNTETPTMAGKPQTLQDNVFILSINELGLANKAKNGKNTGYFVDEQKRKGYQSVGVSSKGIDNYQAQRYWIRTYNKPNKASGYGDGDVFDISNQGLMNSLSGNNWGCGVRPSVNPKSDTAISGPHNNGNEQYYILFN